LLCRRILGNHDVSSSGIRLALPNSSYAADSTPSRKLRDMPEGPRTPMPLFRSRIATFQAGTPSNRRDSTFVQLLSPSIGGQCPETTRNATVRQVI
jgi:hypothetical protein